MRYSNRYKNISINTRYSPDYDLVGKTISKWNALSHDLDTSGQEIVGRIIQLERIMLKQLERVLQPFGMSHFEYSVLVNLRVTNKENGLQPNHLMARLQCSSGGLSNILKQLESKGFIVRSESTIDGRMIWVNLTQEGAQLADKIMKVYPQEELRLTAMLNTGEREVLKRLLSRLLVGNMAAQEKNSA